MELILHIGDMKTGSSSIQATLETNRALLREAGYFYPPCGKYENHVLLTLPALSRVPRQFAHVDTRETLLTRAERHWAKIAAAVGKHAPEKVILSAENLLGLRASEVPAFLQLVQRHVPGITSTTAICYLRRNSSHYTSRLQQRIKASSLLPPLQPNSYAPKLAQWADQVDRLVVRGLGLDRHPELRSTYFRNYRRVVYLAQQRSEVLEARARACKTRCPPKTSPAFPPFSKIRKTSAN